MSLLRHSIRRLVRSLGFSLGVVSSLGLGVGAVVCVAALSHVGLLRDLPFGDPGRLAALGTVGQNGIDWDVTPQTLSLWAERSRTAAGFTWVKPGSLGLTIAGEHSISGASAAANLPEILGTHPAIGRWFSSGESAADANVVVISHALWVQEFGGDSSVLGRAALRIRNKPYVVIGIMPDGRGYPSKSQFWYPFDGNYSVDAIVRLRVGVTPEIAQSEFAKLLDARSVTSGSGNHNVIVGRLHDRIYGTNRPTLQLLVITVVLLVVLALSNATNLLLAYVAHRRRDLSIQLFLGAELRAVLVQVLMDVGVLCIAAVAGGTMVATIATSALARLAPTELETLRSAHVGLPETVVAFGTGALFAGLLLSFCVSGILRLQSELGSGRSIVPTTRWQTHRGKAALLVAQMASSFALTIVAGLLLRSVIQLRAIDTGFDRSGIVTAWVTLTGARYDDRAARYELAQTLLDRTRNIRGVTSASVGPPPLVGGHGSSYTDGYSNIVSVRDSAVAGAPLRSVWVKYVDPAYFTTFNIPIRVGRSFTASDAAGAPRVAIVNESAERLLFSNTRALGQQASRLPSSLQADGPLTVVGVVPDVRQRDITIAAAPEIWLPVAQRSEQYRELYFSARTVRNPVDLARQVRAIIRLIDPHIDPRRVSTMDEIVDHALAPQRFTLFITTNLALLAIGLSALGLYAALAYSTALRTREIGVRMALGATPRTVLVMMLVEAWRLIALGVLFGLPLSLALAATTRRFLFGVSAEDPVTYLLAGTLLFVTGTVAAIGPTIKASRLQPTIALRSE